MSEHISVMPERAMELLDVKEDGIYVDGTLGRGGHSRRILEKLTTGRLYCFDLDEEAILLFFIIFFISKCRKFPAFFLYF